MILLYILLLGDVEAAAKLAEIRAGFSSRDKSESLRELERLARSASTTEAGGQAAAWRGALAQQAGDLNGAQLWYAQAAAAPAGGEAQRLAARGLGDLDLLARRYSDAQRHYFTAATGAQGILAEELAQKQLLAARLEQRQWGEWLCWIFVIAAFGYFCWRAWRGRDGWQPPLEAVYVLPIYLLLVAGALGRDAHVLRALVVGGGGSLALIAAAGWAGRRAPPGERLRWLHALLLLAANFALFFAVLNRTGLVDTLIMTTQM